MAKTEQFHQTTSERQARTFSESFKRQKVAEIEKNQSRVSDICREYQVTRTAIYKWIYQYSAMKKKAIRQVIESESDTKKLLALRERVKELERIIGQKQIMIDFKDRMIDIAEEHFNIDIKKKFGSQPSSGFGTTDPNIPGK